MKVVQELVAYFDRRGRLTKRQIRNLLDQGLLAGDAPVNMLELVIPPAPRSTFACAAT